MAHETFKYFLIEAQELLTQLGQGALDLETGGAEIERISRLLRHAHTLKGAARVVGQRKIADRAHMVESLLEPYRSGGGRAPRDLIDQMLAHVDGMSKDLAELSRSAEGKPEQAAEGGFEHLLPLSRVDVGDLDVLLDSVAEAHRQLEGLRRGLEQMRDVKGLARLVSRRAARADPQPPAAAAQARPVTVINELCDRIDRLQRASASNLEQIDRELRQAHHAASRMRLLPAGLMFTSLERAVRDVGQSLGRQVVFEAKGGEIRLDPRLLGTIQSALVQLVRNAVAHGIEPTHERLGRAKSASGRVGVSVVGHGNRIAFTCQDDGRGIDVDAVRQAAVRSGRAPQNIQNLTDEDLFELLLKGGLSTSGRVTEISGRGIGLDLVRDAANKLLGTVAVRTSPGEGTSFEILVPVSLSSLQALLIEDGGRLAAIPSSAVLGAMRIQQGDIIADAGRSSVAIDGALIPLVPLGCLLQPDSQGATAQSRRSAVIVEAQGRKIALSVDRLIGMELMIFRPLPEMAPADPVVAGTSLDGTGRPRIVLDPEEITAIAHDVRAPIQPPPRLPVLVIDDSLTTRMLEQSILESAGYEVDLATSGEEALQKAHQRRYGLFLVDVEMPGMDGFAFVERTRADPDLREIPAILVTSRGAPEDRDRGAKAGAAGYIVKSEFDQAELLALLRRRAS